MWRFIFYLKRFYKLYNQLFFCDIGSYTLQLKQFTVEAVNAFKWHPISMEEAGNEVRGVLRAIEGVNEAVNADV